VGDQCVLVGSGAIAVARADGLSRPLWTIESVVERLNPVYLAARSVSPSETILVPDYGPILRVSAIDGRVLVSPVVETSGRNLGAARGEDGDLVIVVDEWAETHACPLDASGHRFVSALSLRRDGSIVRAVVSDR
jgi:hypothetical protein